ncbi:MAG: acyltransferase [Gemmatimonadales bacterium]
MPIRPLRQLSLAADAITLREEWLADLAARVTDPDADWSVLTRDTLFELTYPGQGTWEERIAEPGISRAGRMALDALDPRNVTLEPEYYAEVDTDRFARVKPLLWLWYSFDRLPAGGQNVDLGVRLRRMLAPFIFARVGTNFKCFQHVEFSFGYDMEVGDDVVVHRHVLLDDRGGITLGDRVSISDYANIYSHTHSIVEQKDVTSMRTVLEDDVRITYHATVLAGVRVGENGMVGAGALATKDVRPYHVHVGIPAKSIRVKPNAPAAMISTSMMRPPKPE